jgi:hypothetical protein
MASSSVHACVHTRLPLPALCCNKTLLFKAWFNYLQPLVSLFAESHTPVESNTANNSSRHRGAQVADPTHFPVPIRCIFVKVTQLLVSIIAV